MAKKEPWYLKENDVLNKIAIVDGKKWRKLLALRKKETQRKFLKLYGGRQSFNIYDQLELEKVIKTLRKTAEEIGWELADDVGFKDEYQEIKAREALLEKDRGSLEIQLKKLKEQQAKSNIAKYKTDLKTFKGLLDTAEKESELQNWIEEHLWMLGTEYLDAQPLKPSQFPFGDSIADFFLQRYDTFYDIIELKLPSVKLFKGNVEGAQESVSRSSPITAKVGEAISQMIHYIELTTYMKQELEELGIPIYKPAGIIIIGRTLTKKDAVRLKSVTSYLTNISILSYDNLLQKAENFVKRLESL